MRCRILIYILLSCLLCCFLELSWKICAYLSIYCLINLSCSCSFFRTLAVNFISDFLFDFVGVLCFVVVVVSVDWTLKNILFPRFSLSRKKNLGSDHRPF